MSAELDFFKNRPTWDLSLCLPFSLLSAELDFLKIRAQMGSTSDLPPPLVNSKKKLDLQKTARKFCQHFFLKSHFAKKNWGSRKAELFKYSLLNFGTLLIWDKFFTISSKWTRALSSDLRKYKIIGLPLKIKNKKKFFGTDSQFSRRILANPFRVKWNVKK